MQDYSYQQRYWNELTQLKAHVEYFRLHQFESEKFDRGIKIFLALAASGGIAAWAVWDELQRVWALIIAISQVLNAVGHLLPWEKRLKVTSSLVFDMEEIFLFAEGRWFDVAEGNLTSRQINELIMELKRKKNRVYSKLMKDVVLPDRPGFIRKAQQSAADYFRSSYYAGGEEK